MPWTCPVCSDEVTDDRSACPRPECRGRKADWTVGAHTRQLVVTGPRLEVLRGAQEEPVPAGEVEPGEPLSETDVAPVLPKQLVVDLFRSGRRPGPAHVVVVRVWQPGQQKSLSLIVEYAHREAAPATYPLRATGYLETRFLFVHGEDPPGWEEVAFPLLELHDLSEEGEPGHAPSLEVEALRKRRELQVEAVRPPDRKVYRVAPAATRFLHESALALPLEGSPHPVAALVRAAGHLVDRAPRHRLVLVGHTSASGSQKKNRDLSQARAESLLHLITDDREAWVELAATAGCLRDVKGYLAYLTRERGWSCDPGELDAKNDAAAKRGIEAFQREFNQRRQGTLAEDGVCGRLTLGALYDVLDDELERWLAKHGLRRDHLRLADPPVLACGERHAASDRLPSPVSDETRRCVDLLLVPTDVPIDDAVLYSGQVEVQELALGDEPGAWERGRFLLVTDVDPKLDPPPDDRFTLRAADGSFERTLSTRDDAVRDFGGVDLVFDDVPTGARFELISEPAAGERRTLFSDVPYPALGRQSDYDLLRGDDVFELPEEE